MDAAYLRSRLHYNPATGVFTWLAKVVRPSHRRFDMTWNTNFAGKPAGMVNSLGYRQINIDGKVHRANRLAWLYVHGEWPSLAIDHRDCDKANDRIRNLRLATDSQNAANRRISTRNTSGAKGVSWHVRQQKWVASICRDGVQHHLGTFDSVEEGSAAYKSASQRLFGQFARAA